MIKDKAIIIIAVSDYKSSGTYKNLPGALNSAKAMEDWFTQGVEDQDYRVLSITDESGKDVTVHRVKMEVKEFLESDYTDRLIIYFVGHGIARGNYERFWLLSNFEKDSGESLSVEKCNDVIKTYNVGGGNEDIEYGQLCIISDACANLGRASLDVTGNPIASKGGLPVDFLEIERFFSTSVGDFSLEIKDPKTNLGKPYTLFTHFLLRALNGEAIDEEPHKHGRVVTNQSIIKYLRRALPPAAKQHDITMLPEIQLGFLRSNDFYKRFPVTAKNESSDTSKSNDESDDRWYSTTREYSDKYGASAKPPWGSEESYENEDYYSSGNDGYYYSNDSDDSTYPVETEAEYYDDEAIEDIRWRLLGKNILEEEPTTKNAAQSFERFQNDVREQIIEVKQNAFEKYNNIALIIGGSQEKQLFELALSRNSNRIEPYNFALDRTPTFISSTGEGLNDLPLWFQMNEKWLLIPRYPSVTTCIHFDFPLDIFYYLKFTNQWDNSASDHLNAISNSAYTPIQNNTLADKLREEKASFPHYGARAGYLYSRSGDTDNILRTAHYMAHQIEFGDEGAVPFDLAVLCATNIVWQKEGGRYVAYADFPEVARMSEKHKQALENIGRPRFTEREFPKRERERLWGIVPTYTRGWEILIDREDLDLPSGLKALETELGGRTVATLSSIGMQKFCEIFQYERHRFILND